MAACRPRSASPVRLCAEKPASRGSHGGELTAVVSAGAVGQDDVTELGTVLIEEADGRRSAGDIRLFDSTGLAIQDLAIAKAAFAKTGELDRQQLEL